jgi:hypothetical protein
VESTAIFTPCATVCATAFRHRFFSASRRKAAEASFRSQQISISANWLRRATEASTTSD